MAKPDKLFPITIRNAHQHYIFRKIWDIKRPAKLTWYEVDAVILSPIRIAFNVYDMEDTCYGGRGHFIDTVGYDLTVKETETIKPVMEDTMKTIAHGMFREAKAARELVLETAERKEIFDNLTFEDYQND